MQIVFWSAWVSWAKGPVSVLYESTNQTLESWTVSNVTFVHVPLSHVPFIFYNIGLIMALQITAGWSNIWAHTCIFPNECDFHDSTCFIKQFSYVFWGLVPLAQPSCMIAFTCALSVKFNWIAFYKVHRNRLIWSSLLSGILKLHSLHHGKLSISRPGMCLFFHLSLKVKKNLKGETCINQ